MKEADILTLLSSTMHVRDILFRTAASSIEKTARALRESHCNYGSNALMQFATQLLWTAYFAVVSDPENDGEDVVVAAMLPITRGELGGSISESALGSTLALTADCDVPALKLSRAHVRMLRLAVKDIVESHCRLSETQKRSLAAAVLEASPRRVLLSPAAPDLVRAVRLKLALDNADVLGSIRRIERVAACLHSRGPKSAPNKSGLWCAAQVVAGLPDIAAVLHDIVLMVHIPSVVNAVHNAAADDDEPDELLLRAGVAWRNAEGGLRRLMLDAQVLLHYTGNDAEIDTVLESIKRNAASACDSYAMLGATACAAV
jgi:hypothetical protein